jgi:HAE1 family hydrophobic/amphiphilic exporter-1
VAQFFIRRPIVAIVISILMLLMGVYTLTKLSFEQYPFLAPPIVRVTATYPGASAVAVEQSVATPVEQEVNGVDRMIYMQSSNTSDGRMQLDVNFQVGVDQDTANVLTQNRVASAQARLPQEVNAQGVTVKKQSPSILMLISVYSPNGSYTGNYLINYCGINIRDQILRIPGIAQVDLFGGADYGMRLWVRPDKMAKLGITPADIISSIKEQNLQAPAGKIGGAPTPKDQEFTYTVSAPSRLISTEEFENIIIRGTEGASQVRIRDIGRAELGAQDYNSFGRMNGKPAGTMAVYLLPGADQLKAAHEIYETMKRQQGLFPPDMDYKIVYDTTPAVEASIHEIVKTFVEALILVTLVVFIFLQSVRATIIPLLTIPVSIVGTFIFFPMLGFSVNTLSMFGLVLAIGIVVDDAIVVVEAVIHHMEHGLGPREATVQAMKEVSAPVIGIALILSAVFVPVAFLGGLTGRMYQQFALTIAISVLLSAFNALSLTPALCAMFLKPGSHAISWGPIGAFFRGFNKVFDRATNGYMHAATLLVRKSILTIARGGGDAGRRPLRRRPAFRLHPRGGPGHLRHQRAAPARGLARAHRRCPDDGRGDRRQDARCRCEHHDRRLRRGHQHLSAELRHRVRAATSLGGAARQGPARHRDHGEPPAEVRRDPRGHHLPLQHPHHLRLWRLGRLQDAPPGPERHAHRR